MIFLLRCRVSNGTITMHELKKQVEHLFQNLSEPWCTDIEQLLVANSPAAQKSSSPGLVSSISAAITRPLEKGFATATGPSSWLSRKSSFKAAAKQIRSVSVTTMIPRSPSTQHARVPSIKSAKASIMRKNSSSIIDASQQQGNVPMQPSPTSSSICTTASQDMTSLSMPSLEHKNQGFWIYDEDEDSDDMSSRLEVDSIIEDEIAESENEVNEGYFNETDWAKAALQKRLDKGRVDSTSTNEVTYINTILNQSIGVTDEGQAIRRRIADDTCSVSSPPVQAKPQPILIIKGQRQTSEDISLGSMDPPPILTIEPPSPMPFLMCASPQSESDERGTKQSLNESTNSTEAVTSDSSHDLQSNQLFLRPNKQRRRGKRSSNSFCVRDRNTCSQETTTNSSSRSSSLPPNNFNFCVDYFDCNEMTNSVTNTTSSYPRRLHDNIANHPSSKNGSSRHSSGEPENVVTGCSPKGNF